MIPGEVEHLEAGESVEAHRAGEPVVGDVEDLEGWTGRAGRARFAPEGAAEAVGGEVDLEEGRGGPQATWDRALKGVPREVEDLETSDVPQEHPRHGAAEISIGEPYLPNFGALWIVSGGRGGKLES